MKNTKALFGTLSITMILAVQVQAQSFLTNGLVAYYLFNGNANDASGNGHNGVVNGTSISPTTNQLGVSNAALHFGGGSYISVTPTPFNVNSNWTVSLWCIIDAGEGGAHNFVSTDQDTYGGLNIRWVGDQFPLPWALIANWHGGGWPAAAGCGVAATNNPHSWNMLTCVRSGYSFKMFLNNILVASNTVVGTASDTGALWFGNHQSWATYFLRGSLSNIRIYNRALSSDEVAQLYAYESLPIVGLRKAVSPSLSNLYLGTNYQLQVSTELSTWTNNGPPFTPTNTVMDYPQYVDVENWGSLFFRLQAAP